MYVYYIYLFMSIVSIYRSMYVYYIYLFISIVSIYIYMYVCIHIYIYVYLSIHLFPKLLLSTPACFAGALSSGFGLAPLSEIHI